MAFEPINEEIYDETATFITYAKIFPYIMDHFVTRKDARQMMLPSNLPVKTTVTVMPGQAVQVVVPAGTGSTTSPATGNGQGTAQPSYDGSYANAESQLLKQEIKAKKEAGATTVTGLTEGIAKATGV